MRRGLNKNEQGLTLVEVLVAIVIIGVALVPVMSIFPAGLFTYTEAAADTFAINLAQGIMEEEVMARPYDAVVSRPAASIPGFSYHSEIIVEVINPERRLKEVWVAVWPSDDPAERTELVTLVSGR
jgi:prepilin-type N-terminal cleavage/methylation domain-containing protein